MRTPVIVGAAALSQHTDEQEHGVDAVGLMAEACRAAEQASGASGLLAQADLVVVPRGSWRYPDPARLVADGVGAANVRTEIVEIGVLQTTVLSRALEAVATGGTEVALVVGGEALDRRRVARRQGRRASERVQDPSVVPGAVIAAEVDFRGKYEGEWGLEEAYLQYALLDSALRHRLGLGIEENRAQIAELWAQFNRIAAANPAAWDRTPWSAEQLLDHTRRGNRPLADPYSVKTVTQMHVDQAAALIICSAGAADRAGVAEDRRIYPVVTVESDLAVPVVERADPGECAQWGFIAAELERAIGAPVATVDLLDLYSCFPIAVAHQRDAFGVTGRADLTVTGGMTFGGGPLNNAALQAMATAAHLLQNRSGPASGVVTAVSGLLAKQGAVLLARDRPERGYRRVDVTDRARDAVRTRPVVARYTGRAIVDALTVLVARDGRAEIVAVLATPEGAGTVARSADQDLVQSARATDWVGATVEVADGEIVARIRAVAAGDRPGSG